MDYQSAVRVVRACADGPDAFWAAVDADAGFDALQFESIAQEHRVAAWLAPVFEGERAGQVFSGEMLEAVESRRRGAQVRNAAIAQVIPEISKGFAAAGIDV